jgi:hypothetical protein
VDRLLREVVAASRSSDAARDAARQVVGGAALPAEAIEALARALGGPSVRRYRAESRSKPGAYYVLEVDGADVTCTCRGFEYRGACEHARGLKAALAKGTALPSGVTPITS